MCYSQRNYTDCDVLEIDKYEKLLAVKKNDLQVKVNAAIDEACGEIKSIQSQLNEMIETDPRISLDILTEHISTTTEMQNLVLSGLKSILIPKTKTAPGLISSSSASSSTTSAEFQVGSVPRRCRLIRENYTSGWGFTVTTLRSQSVVGNVDSGSVAEKAGIKKNDQILEIYHVSTTGLNIRKIVQLIRAVNTLDMNLLVKKDETYI